MGWYFKRLYVRVRPERVYVWEAGDIGAEPLLLDTRIEEVRSAHAEEPEDVEPGMSRRRGPMWDDRMDQLGDRYETRCSRSWRRTASRSRCACPWRPTAGVHVSGIPADPVGAPLRPGRACLTAHDHGERFEWQRNFQVRGDLVEDGDGWALSPRKLVGGFELPPGIELRAHAHEREEGDALPQDRQARGGRDRGAPGVSGKSGIVSPGPS